MNTFTFLPEENDNYEINNDNQLRNKKKKLQKKIKRQDNPTDDLLKEINILKIDIREYEESKQTYILRKRRKRKKKKI